MKILGKAAVMVGASACVLATTAVAAHADVVATYSSGGYLRASLGYHTSINEFALTDNRAEGWGAKAQYWINGGTTQSFTNTNGAGYANTVYKYLSTANDGKPLKFRACSVDEGVTKGCGTTMSYTV